MTGARIAIVGSGGLVGKNLVREILSRGCPVVGMSHAELDITDYDAVEKWLDREAPDWVINAAAICNFDRCEDEPELSRKVNLEAPLELARMCRERGIRMCQFSSDYVFDGSKHAPYTEGDPTRPVSVYARHKAALEEGFAEYPEHLVARLAWVFGHGGATFMSRMPGLLMERDELTVASGKAGSCLYAGYGARVICDLLERGASGLVNVVHDGATAWEEVADECLLQLRAAGVQPRCEHVKRVPFREMPALKPGRPDYSVLAVDRLGELLGRPVQPWREGVAEFVREWMERL